MREEEEEEEDEEEDEEEGEGEYGALDALAQHIGNEIDQLQGVFDNHSSETEQRMAKVEGTLCKLDAHVSQLMEDSTKLAAAITALRAQQVIHQTSKLPAAAPHKGKAAAASPSKGSFDAAFVEPTQEQQLACIVIFQLRANIKVYYCRCGGEYSFHIASAGGQSGSAGKAFGRGNCGYCYKELISESQLADMYCALSGGSLAIATKKIGEKSRDPPIPEKWAESMFDLVSAHDSSNKPIFNPTQVFMEDPGKKTKQVLSFTPKRAAAPPSKAKKRAAEAPDEKKEKKAKKAKKEKKAKKDRK